MAEIEAAGGRAVAVGADLTRPEEIGPMVDEVAAFAGESGLGVLVNNAGIYPPGTIETLTVEEWDRVFALNARAPFLVTQAALPLLRRAGAARVINIGTVMFHRGAPTSLHYVASKGAVMGLTHSLARALGPDGITVNCLVPSIVGTETVNRNHAAWYRPSSPSSRCAATSSPAISSARSSGWRPPRAPSRRARRSWPTGVGSSSDEHRGRGRGTMTLHAPQLITAARMLYAVWLPADPAAAAALVPEGLTAREGAPVYLNQYVVDDAAQTSGAAHPDGFGAYSLTYLGDRSRRARHRGRDARPLVDALLQLVAADDRLRAGARRARDRPVARRSSSAATASSRRPGARTARS